MSNSLLKILLCIVGGIILAGFALCLLPILLAVIAVALILQCFFGIKVAQFKWNHRWNRPWDQRQRRRPPVEPPAPDIPASEAVIDAEVTDLHEEPLDPPDDSEQ